MSRGLLRTTLLLLLLLLWDGVCALSAPSGLSISSINLRHILKWLPLQDHCDTTLLYSVQYQGNFERQVKNGSWCPAVCCQLILLRECDLSAELQSDSDYILRVRGHCRDVVSPWQQLATPFNRNETVLLEPVLKLDVLGDSLLVSITDVPQICSVRVSLWRTGQEDQVLEWVQRSDRQFRFDSADLLVGEEYCIQAQSELLPGSRSSPKATQCVRIPGPGDVWQMPVTVVFTVLLTLGFLCAVLWFIVHYTPTCLTFFHKEALPNSLVWPAVMPEQPQEQSVQVPILRVVPESSVPSTVALL